MTWGAVFSTAVGVAGNVGMGIYSHNNQPDGSTPFPRSLNPGMQQLNYIFGQPTYTRYSSRGNPIKKSAIYGPNPDVTFGQSPGRGNNYDKRYAGETISGDVFGTGLKESIADYLKNPTATIPGTDKSLWESILGGAEGFQAGLDRFKSGMGAAVDTARSLVDTGLKTDGKIFFDEALRMLRTDVTPMLADTAGFGTGSSGFLQGGYQAGEDLLGKAALADIDLQEAATNRRMAASPLLASLLAAEQTIPLNWGQMLTSISDSERLGGLNLFQQLFNMGSNSGPYTVPGFNPSSPGAGYTAAAGGINDLISGLGSFDFSSLFGGNTTTTTPNFTVGEG